MCAQVIDLAALDEGDDFELVDVHETFRHFNELCFDQTLEAVCVSWSKRLTLSAGRCRFKGQRYCEITLSEPILKYRSAKECKVISFRNPIEHSSQETLLHEMIHAHLFLTKQYKNVKAHGKEFIWHMHRVNEITGLNVTIHHNFHEEVAYHRKHVWRCSGPCQLLAPHYGYLRRARNLAPGPRDRWWESHQMLCGGNFHKVAEPPATGNRQRNKRHKHLAKVQEQGSEVELIDCIAAERSNSYVTVDSANPTVVIDLCDKDAT
ncbi:SprT-like domain-containing protein Spartan [Babesia sp. Xinjiang]|uniref:SprT-like domain-containing protein Spartan n=1 Tax=Babesia sp. Xinjiang TaxID=462227 RepID=UPI000A2500B5|nr:SprT-like domain-containing protein Spartan [Babesia sp. Xinjiang]ORM41497.1 SprT-like domain-containing protein Spartan [Babesia sp. Xinjiang]